MVVEESRILQVSIFHTIQYNLAKVDFSTLLLSVITIADEVDSQLKQAMLSYAAPVPGWRHLVVSVSRSADKRHVQKLSNGLCDHGHMLSGTSSR